MSRSLTSINTLKLSNLSINNNQTQVIVTDTAESDQDKLEYQRPAYVAVGLIMGMTAFSIFFPLIVTSSAFGLRDNVYDRHTKLCTDPCSISLVESIPENMTYPAGAPTHPSTYDTWRRLIQMADKSIEIASLYWTLKGSDIGHEDPSDKQGQQIFKDLMDAGVNRKVKIRIAQSLPSAGFPDTDTQELAAAGAALVRSVNFTRIVGAGVLHTKLWIVDGKHLYVGSANMDWRSLTQVKELGAVVYNCSCMAADMAKVWEVYWYLGLPNNTVPYKWPYKYSTVFNDEHPLKLKFNRSHALTYISSSPSQFCPSGRTIDLDAILDVIQKAKKYIYIAVMDYFPTTLYTHKTKFWPVIDNALRRAALERGVEVRLMASWWNYSRHDIVNFLRSLSDLNGANNASIQVRLFHVPACTPAQASIPYARVNHNKYMVTEAVTYIGTSNWSADYFINTGGAGLVVNQTTARATTPTVQRQLTAVFVRDWTSQYALPLDSGVPPTCRKRAVGKRSRKGSEGTNDL